MTELGPPSITSIQRWRKLNNWQGGKVGLNLISLTLGLAPKACGVTNLVYWDSNLYPCRKIMFRTEKMEHLLEPTSSR